MKRFLAHLWPFALGAATAAGVIAATSAMTGNLGLGVVVALAASALLAFTALEADNERIRRLKETQTDESLAGGLHRPELIPAALDELHRIEIVPHHADSHAN